MSALSENPRNIVFFGETGAGKSSTINLLLASPSAPVSNDSQPCTKAAKDYGITLDGTKYTLWDTRGLGAGRSLFQIIFGLPSSEKQLKKFLKERHLRRELDLLVYCVRGLRATNASVGYYNNFCAITRQLAAPVVILVTHLEREQNMEEWWNKNSSSFKDLKMEFDDHVCITTLPGHPRRDESRKRLVEFITKKRYWRVVQGGGSYFGSPVHMPTPSAVSPAGRPFPRIPERSTISDGIQRSSSATVSIGDETFHTAVESPGSSVPSSPVVELPTPLSVIPEVAQMPQIDTNPLEVDEPLQSSGEETCSSGLSSYSLISGPHSSNTSHAEELLQPCTDDDEDPLMRELPFRYSAASIVRQQGYATQQGNFADVWKCDLVSGESPPVMVAVKAMRVNAGDDNDVRSKELRRELRIWAGLQHPNIVPLLGTVSGFGLLPSMVSPWFNNGSLSYYLEHHCLSMLEKHRLLGNIAAGLSYLHSRNITHGDLHSGNVLIDNNECACLTDFGLSINTEFVGTSYLNSSVCGAARFADPALVQLVFRSQDHQVYYPTKPCDVYSFGGLLLHVMSGKKPYDGILHPELLLKIMDGERPSIPTHDKSVTPLHRSLIRQCWDPLEHRRPSADGLVTMFAPK